MERFFGTMPSDVVDIYKKYKASNGARVTIEAGPFGWTIIWCDYSTTYKDEDDTSDNNFKKAYDRAVSIVGPLTEVK